MKYEIVESVDSISDLESQVVNMIKMGWKPIGGVSVSLSEDDNYRYFIATQAMIKEENI